MDRILKILFFALLVKPVILVGLGLNIRGRSNLPKHGPAVIAANHNSHLDTMVLMSMYPLSRIHMIRPIAAADYFFRNKYLKWFSLNIIGIIPLDRSGKTNREALFTDCHLALDKGQTLLIFPEGSRGKPEELSKLRKGLFYLIKDRNDTKVTPVVMHGLGRALPKGEALFVPFNCDVIIGKALKPEGSSTEFMETIRNRYDEMLDLCLTKSSQPPL